MAKDLIATGFGLRSSKNNAQLLRFEFQNEQGERVGIVFPRSQAAVIIAQLQAKLPGGQGAPLTSQAAKTGRTISIDGTTVQANAQNKSVVLTLHATFPDNGNSTTIPYPMSFSEAQQLANDLARATKA